jgi:hypothetical protein
MLTATELTAMRAVQTAALPDTCTRSRATMAQTAGGGFAVSSTATITLACRVSSRGVPDEYLRQAVATGRTPVMITVPQGSDVVRTDTLAVSGVTYKVLGFASVGAWETAMRCVCEASK